MASQQPEFGLPFEQWMRLDMEYVDTRPSGRIWKSRYQPLRQSQGYQEPHIRAGGYISRQSAEIARVLRGIGNSKNVTESMQHTDLNSQSTRPITAGRLHKYMGPGTLQDVENKREYIFGGLSLFVLLLFESQWNAPITRNESLAGILSANMGVISSGAIVRKILGLIIGMSGWVWIQRCSTRQIRILGIRSWILGIWGIWLCASVLWSEDPSLTIRRLGVFVMLFVSALGMASLRSSTVFALFTAMSVASLAVGVGCEIFWGTFHPFTAGYRFRGAASPNTQGAILAVGVMAAIGFAMTSRSHKGIAAAAGIVCAAGLILTNSRSAIIALIIGCTFGLLLLIVGRTNSLHRTHVLISILCFVMVLGIALITMQNSSHILLHSVAEHRDDGNTDSFNGRTAVWATCLEYASKRPLLGYGYDTFWTSERISAISSQIGWYINEAHSSYLDEVLNVGSVGTVLFIVAAISTLVWASKRYIRGQNEYFAWALLLLFMFVHSTMEALMMPIATFPAYAVLATMCRLSFIDHATLTAATPLNR